MTPQEIRNIRLKNDYSEMLNIRGDILSWSVLKGTPPYVEEYEIEIKLRGVISSQPLYQNFFKIRVTLPSTYPMAAPEARLIDRPFIFHPNWYRDGRWCPGPYKMSESLGHFVVRLLKTIQYDGDITNENSAANTEANEWYIKMKNRRLFPCDTNQLPDPTKKKMELNIVEKKKFIVTESPKKNFNID